MTGWQEFAADASELAAFGARRLASGVAYLATVRADGSPRVHPVSPFIGEGRLFVYMEPTSPKRHDLRRDRRYSLHCAVEDTEGGGGEFSISGHAVLVEDRAVREIAFRAAREAGFSPKDRYILFELSVERALSTVYTNDGPVRERWMSC